jgi:hypothetical protein
MCPASVIQVTNFRRPQDYTGASGASVVRGRVAGAVAAVCRPGWRRRWAAGRPPSRPDDRGVATPTDALGMDCLGGAAVAAPMPGNRRSRGP